MLKNDLIFGFSLFELLVTLTIAIILVALAIPSQYYFLEKSKDEHLRSQLIRAIEMARSEAIARGEMVMLCKSSDLKTCQGSWQQGYMIHSLDRTIYVMQPEQTKGKLHWRAFPNNQESLQFLPTGFTNSENGTFWYCRQNAKTPV